MLSLIRQMKIVLMSFLVLVFHIPTVKSDDVVRVFAAASLTGALSELSALYQSRTNSHVSTVFASSSTLAKQIINGAPADIFISAHPTWMDKVEETGGVDPSSRTVLLGNTLSLISPAQTARRVDLSDQNSIEMAMAGGRLAMGDPDHVPAGIYAKSALNSLGRWQSLKHRIVAAPNVRAALTFVERGEVNLGVVYTSDITGRPGIREVARFPETTHSPIKYTMAIARGRTLIHIVTFFDFLQSDAARVIFSNYGFSKPHL